MHESEIEMRKARWRRVMDGEATPRNLLVVRYEGDMEGVLPHAFPLAENVRHRIERALQVYERQVARMQWLKDDALPHLNCLTGTEIFAEAFGCPVHVPNDNMPFALPMVNCAEEAGRVKVPSLDAPPLARAFAMADELVARAGRGTLVRPVDIQSPMDIAALIWEKSDFLMAMIESPEAVKELAGKCRELLVAFMDEWQRRYGREHIAHFPDYYMPHGITLSEDEIGVVNNEMFEEFFLPELVALSQHFGAIGIHCCADSKHQWGSFTKIPNLKFLNLKRELGMNAYRYFADSDIIQQHLLTERETWDDVLRACPEARLWIEVKAGTREEAIQLVEQYRSE